MFIRSWVRMENEAWISSHNVLFRAQQVEDSKSCVYDYWTKLKKKYLNEWIKFTGGSECQGFLKPNCIAHLSTLKRNRMEIKHVFLSTQFQASIV